jgi:hypothetical protein
MTVAVVTAIFGGYDQPKPPCPQTVDCTFTLVTDNPDNAAGWETVCVYDDRHPRVAAKEPKLRPWRYADGDAWIWVDGAFRIDSPTFVEDVIAETELIGQWKHPNRDCIYPESAVSQQMVKYFNTPVEKQAHHYCAVGHPPQWGLWATGLIVYRQPLDYLADLWWAEINRWGYQDQISQPVALRRAGLRPTELPHELWANPWLSWHPHRDDQ